MIRRLNNRRSQISIQKEPWYKRADVQKSIFILFAVAPSFFAYMLFTLYPNAVAVYYSMLEWDGISKPIFVGLANYPKMFKDFYVWRALKHNLILMSIIPFLVIMLSLIVGYILSHRNFKEGYFYRVLYFLPNVLSTVIIALLWSFIYDGQFGLLNSLLRLIGIDVGNFYWLGNTSTALYALIPPAIWGGVGFYTIIFMNAMSSIPSSLYEAAILEGASHMTRLFKITIPLVWGVIRIGIIFMVLGAFQGFEMMFVMTGGGPSGSTEVIGLYMFNIAFGSEYRNYGYASTIGMLLFVVLVVVKLTVDKIFPNEKVEY